MGTTAQKLARTEQSKSDIKNALNLRGASVGDNMSTYANAITSLPSGDEIKMVNIREGVLNQFTSSKNIIVLACVPVLGMETVIRYGTNDYGYEIFRCSISPNIWNVMYLPNYNSKKDKQYYTAAETNPTQKSLPLSNTIYGYGIGYNINVYYIEVD